MRRPSAIALARARRESREQQLKNGAYAREHHLLHIKMLPDSLLQLRKLLTQPENKDLYDYSLQGTSFEDCLARIATHLSIVVDGLYDVGPLCAMLCSAIEARNAGLPVGMIPGLVGAEIVEREGTVSLEMDKEVTSSDAVSDPGAQAPKLLLS